MRRQHDHHHSHPPAPRRYHSLSPPSCVGIGDHHHHHHHRQRSSGHTVRHKVRAVRHVSRQNLAPAGGGIYSGGGGGAHHRRQQRLEQYARGNSRSRSPPTAWPTRRRDDPIDASANEGNRIVQALGRSQPGERRQGHHPTDSFIVREEKNDTGRVDNSGDGQGRGGGGGGGSRQQSRGETTEGSKKMTWNTNSRGRSDGRLQLDDAVKVAVRVRPISEREAVAGLQRVVSVDEDEIVVMDPVAYAAAVALERSGREEVDSGMWAKRFVFDRCFWSDDDSGEGREEGRRRAERGAWQEEVFEEIGSVVIDQAFAGYNATVFAYGQTGSGKSYTMMGSGAALDDDISPEDYGLIPRICSGIFDKADQELEVGHPRTGDDNAHYGGSGGKCDTDRADDAFSSRQIPNVTRSTSSSLAAAAETITATIPTTLTHYCVEVSYLEIYNETVRDLFNPAAAIGGVGGGGAGGSFGVGGLRVREDPSSGVYVEGLTSIVVSDCEEMSQLLLYGGGSRTVAATNANDWSSRSHAVFTLTFRQQVSVSEMQSDGGGERGAPSLPTWEACSSINLVDLAGSERVAHTGATGVRLQEAGSINRSLAALSDVIKALSEAQRRRLAVAGGRSPRGASSYGGTTDSTTGAGGGGGVGGGGSGSGRETFVPYRNSVLTRLLRESLGGNSRTVMLACVSPCDAHYEETLGTLRYAERAKRVKTRAVANAQRGSGGGGGGGVGGKDSGGVSEGGQREALLVKRLTAQVVELQQRLQIAESASSPARSLSRSPPRPPPRPELGDTDDLSHREIVYVADPALDLEIDRLREKVAERERVIEGLERGGRATRRSEEHEQAHLPTEGAAAVGDGRLAKHHGTTRAKRKDREQEGAGEGEVKVERRLAQEDTDAHNSGDAATSETGRGCGRSSPRQSDSPRVTKTARNVFGNPSFPPPGSCSGAVDSNNNGTTTELTTNKGGGEFNRDYSEGGVGVVDENTAWSCAKPSSHVSSASGSPGGGGGGGGEGPLAMTDGRNVDEDDDCCRILNLNQDPLFSECLIFPISEGATIVGSGEDANIRLDGEEILPRHAIIVRRRREGNEVRLIPMPGARVYVNGRRVIDEPVLREGKRRVNTNVKEAEDGGAVEPAVENLPLSIKEGIGDRTKPSPLSVEEVRGVSTHHGEQNQHHHRRQHLQHAEVEITARAIVEEQEQEGSSIHASYWGGGIGDLGSEAQGVVLIQDCRVVFGQQHFFRFDVKPRDDKAAARAAERERMMIPTTRDDLPAQTTNTTTTSSAKIDWSYAHNELLALSSRSSEAKPVISDKVSSVTTVTRGSTERAAPNTADSDNQQLASSEVNKDINNNQNDGNPNGARNDNSSGRQTTSGKSEEISPLSLSSSSSVSCCSCGGKYIPPDNQANRSGKHTTNSTSLSPLQEDVQALEIAPGDDSSILDASGRDKCSGSGRPEGISSCVSPHDRGDVCGVGAEQAAIVGELLRAREAWRGAEGELARTQADLDELRSVLTAVQEHAKEQRRNNRKVRRELDKEKALAESKARNLEEDRDRLRRALSASDGEAAVLRTELELAQAAAAIAAATGAAGAASAVSSDISEQQQQQQQKRQGNQVSTDGEQLQQTTTRYSRATPPSPFLHSGSPAPPLPPCGKTPPPLQTPFSRLSSSLSSLCSPTTPTPTPTKTTTKGGGGGGLVKSSSSNEKYGQNNAGKCTPSQSPSPTSSASTSSKADDDTKNVDNRKNSYVREGHDGGGGHRDIGARQGREGAGGGRRANGEGEGSEEASEQQQRDDRDTETFLRESRAELASARRLLASSDAASASSSSFDSGITNIFGVGGVDEGVGVGIARSGGLITSAVPKRERSLPYGSRDICASHNAKNISIDTISDASGVNAEAMTLSRKTKHEYRTKDKDIATTAKRTSEHSCLSSRCSSSSSSCGGGGSGPVLTDSGTVLKNDSSRSQRNNRHKPATGSSYLPHPHGPPSRGIDSSNPYRSALSTHLSFSAGNGRGGDNKHPGEEEYKSKGTSWVGAAGTVAGRRIGVGEASRTLRHDVADVRERLETLQMTLLSRGGAGDAGDTRGGGFADSSTSTEVVEIHGQPSGGSPPENSPKIYPTTFGGAVIGRNVFA